MYFQQHCWGCWPLTPGNTVIIVLSVSVAICWPSCCCVCSSSKEPTHLQPPSPSPSPSSHHVPFRAPGTSHNVLFTVYSCTYWVGLSMCVQRCAPYWTACSGHSMTHNTDSPLKPEATLHHERPKSFEDGSVHLVSMLALSEVIGRACPQGEPVSIGALKVFDQVIIIPVSQRARTVCCCCKRLHCKSLNV